MDSGRKIAHAVPLKPGVCTFLFESTTVVRVILLEQWDRIVRSLTDCKVESAICGQVTMWRSIQSDARVALSFFRKNRLERIRISHIKLILEAK